MLYWVWPQASQGLPVQLYFRFRWPFDLFLCSSIDMCGLICFGIYVSGFVPVCTFRSIFRWFDCDMYKLDSFAFGSIYFEAFELLFGGSIYFCAVRFIFLQVGFICTSFDLFLRFWLYVNDFRFTFDHLIMFVRVSFCLFCNLRFWP